MKTLFPGVLIRLSMTVALLCSALILSSCIAVVHSEKPFEAWVVDADTSRPLQGVVVVATWLRYGFSIHGGIPKGVVKTLDAKSDESGRLFMSAWGPSVFFSSSATGPELIFYKSGYDVLHISGGGLFSEYADSSVVDIQSKQIRLKKNHGNQKELAKNLIKLDKHFDNFNDNQLNCEWEDMPNLLTALVRDKMEFERKKMEWPYIFLDSLWHQDKKYIEFGCTKPKIFIRDVYAKSLTQ